MNFIKFDTFLIIELSFKVLDVKQKQNLFPNIAFFFKVQDGNIFKNPNNYPKTTKIR